MRRRGQASPISTRSRRRCAVATAAGLRLLRVDGERRRVERLIGRTVVGRIVENEAVFAGCEGRPRSKLEGAIAVRTQDDRLHGASRAKACKHPLRAFVALGME